MVGLVLLFWSQHFDTNITQGQTSNISNDILFKSLLPFFFLFLFYQLHYEVIPLLTCSLGFGLTGTLLLLLSMAM